MKNIKFIALFLSIVNSKIVLIPNNFSDVCIIIHPFFCFFALANILIL